MFGPFEPNPRRVILEYFRDRRSIILHYLLLFAVPAVISLVGLGGIFALLAGVRYAGGMDIAANFILLLALDWIWIGASFLTVIGFVTLLSFSLWQGEVLFGRLTVRYWPDRETRLIATLNTFLRLAPFYWGVYIVSLIIFTLIVELFIYLGAQRSVILVAAILITAPIVIIAHILQYFLLARQFPQIYQENDAPAQKPALVSQRVVESIPNWLIHLLAATLKTRFSRFIAGFIILPALIISAIWLPLVVGATGLYDLEAKRIGREGGTLQMAGRVRITFPAEAVPHPFWVRLEAIPRSAFLEGEAGRRLLVAAQNIPTNLVLKSHFYRFQAEGTVANSISVTIRIPEDVVSDKLLDLYTWDGENWQWLPSRKNSTKLMIEATLDDLPSSIVMMQANPLPLKIATDYHPNDPLPGQAQDALTEINPQGFQLDRGGRIRGEPAAIVPEALMTAFDLAPTLGNWEDETGIQADLINALLIEPNVRRRHIKAIVDLVQDNNYAGIDLAYRGIDPNLRQTYTDFLDELRQALPTDKQLSVWVELPRQIGADRWETGAYDWQAIGLIADAVKIPPLPDPRTYVAGDQMESLLDWAVGQVNRSKLQPILGAGNLEQINGISRQISDRETFAHLDIVIPSGIPDIVTSGDQLDFILDGPQINKAIQLDNNSGIYWFAYVDDNETQHTIYLENAATISDKLQFIGQYNLGGVTLQNLLGSNIYPQIEQVINQFPDLVIPPLENKYNLTWQVEAEATGAVIEQTSRDLSEANFTWTAPTFGGGYEIRAVIAATQNGAEIISLGSVKLNVAAATPLPSPTPLVQIVTPTPSVVVIPATPTITPTPTPPRLPEPTTTPADQAASADGSCPHLVRGEFAELWQANQEEFGCPIETEPLSGVFIEMSFERGHLFWIKDIERYGEVRLVFATVGGQNEGETGLWSLHPENWNGEGICPVGPPPEGLFLPDRNLAKVWCEINGLDLLGYATIPQEVVVGPGQATLQNFDNVILLKDSQGDAAGLVYILFRADNHYVRMAYDDLN